MRSFLIPFSVSLASCVLLLGCLREPEAVADASTPKPGDVKVGFITNGIADFWTIAIAGAKKAAADLGVHVKTSEPTKAGGASDQKAAMEDMISAGFHGIAISPIDADNQTSLLNKIAKKTILITQDSDAPHSKRRCFIGVNNYVAGRMCGQLVKQAIPDGGKVMLFIGRMSGDNAKLRRQGVIDELLGRSEDSSRRDPTGNVIKSDDGKFIILGCLTDGMDYTVAKNNAEDTLTNHADIACMVGLFAYNPPLILQALIQSKRLNQVKVVGFDEDAATLQGIRDGTVFGTVVQDPYKYGYESVRVLAALAKGDDKVVPAGGVIGVPAREITKGNVDAFEAELNARLGK